MKYILILFILCLNYPVYSQVNCDKLNNSCNIILEFTIENKSNIIINTDNSNLIQEVTTDYTREIKS